MICYFLKCFTVKKVSLKYKIGYKRFLLAMSVRDEDQTCTNTDDLTSNKFEQQPQKKKKQTKMDPDGLCHSWKSLAYFQK